MIYGLIPAAGKSERMGTPKLALRIGERTLLEHVIATLHAGGVDHVLVVLGPHVTDLAAIAKAAGAEVMVLPEPTAHMLATVQHGLEALLARNPAPTDFWMLAPADHPTMDADVVRKLIETSRPLPPGSIVVPTWQGRRGHPVFIGWPHAEAIRSFPGQIGRAHVWT